ncbi:unnamed protein product [Schistosoma mattheei]|uniref:Uncharacterized protein n=1 Tax=Schistosoma mattheei TaxID=31246 RepID=A0A3P8D9U5_9TREM|nr:unnamed protein product [Schistosoma mattheei]
MKELDVKTILIVGFIKKPAEILVNNKPVDFMFDNDLETCQIKNQSFSTLTIIEVLLALNNTSRVQNLILHSVKRVKAPQNANTQCISHSGTFIDDSKTTSDLSNGILENNSELLNDTDSKIM